MKIAISFEKIKIYTTEHQAKFMRLQLLKRKIHVSDVIMEFVLLPTVKLTIIFPDEQTRTEFTNTEFYRILDKTLMLCNAEIQKVEFEESHYYFFSRALKWGKKYEYDANVTLKILHKEKQELKERERLYKKMKKLNN